jgi:cytochrome b6-f complex iron-sulfur subunit
MERREFIKNCTFLCAGGIGLSILIESCGSVHYASSTLDKNRVRVSKAEFSDAKKRDREFVVVRTEKFAFPICLYKKGNDYTAIYMQCSHQGCELNPNKTSLVCPCHGSEFSTSGKVLSPPADKDLKQFNIITDNENIYIEL